MPFGGTGGALAGAPVPAGGYDATAPQHAGHRARAWGLVVVLALLAGGAIWIYVARSNAQENKKAAMELTGGDPDRGKAAIEAYGCASCHTIPGIRGADALVGPPLTQVGSRMYIGGVLSNTPENMTAWLRDPPGIDPKTAMPNLNVSDEDARDIAGYLYTLK